VSQINALVDSMIASLLASGSISWLYYSDPDGTAGRHRRGDDRNGVVAEPVALSSRGDMAAFDRTIDWGVRTCRCSGFRAAASTSCRCR
jgi:putative peptidoglycan lipid II flippase